MSLRLVLLAILFALAIPFYALAQQSVPKMRVASWSLRVRTLNGDHVCSIPRGTQVLPTGRDAYSERLQVQINAPGCPSTGFIDLRYIRPVPKEGGGYEEAAVDEEGLSFRSHPKVDEATFRCSLPKDTLLDILPEEYPGSTTRWFRVKLKNPVPGCPEDGWVSSSYLRPTLSFDSLPVVTSDERRRTEAKSCQDCELGRDRTDLETQGRQIEKEAQSGETGRSPFLSGLLELAQRKKCGDRSEYRCNRGLIQMLLIGRNAGFCGSHHYNPDSPDGDDAYAEPMTACALTALAQEWKKTACPDRAGCTLSWGDISHKTRARFNGHVSHNEGECIDIRPMRKGGFQDSGITYHGGGYDREKTRQLIEMAQGMGARLVIFNDPALHQEKAAGHHNHVHICFGNNQRTRATCNNLRIDPSICPEAQ